MSLLLDALRRRRDSDDKRGSGKFRKWREHRQMMRALRQQASAEAYEIRTRSKAGTFLIKRLAKAEAKAQTILAKAQAHLIEERAKRVKRRLKKEKWRAGRQAVGNFFRRLNLAGIGLLLTLAFGIIVVVGVALRNDYIWPISIWGAILSARLWNFASNGRLPAQRVRMVFPRLSFVIIGSWLVLLIARIFGFGQ